MNPIIIIDGITTGQEFTADINNNFNELNTLISSGETGQEIVNKLNNLLITDKLTTSGITHNTILLDQVLDQVLDDLNNIQTYTNLTPMPTSLGGLNAGTTFSGMSTNQIFDQLFYPYQNPTLSNFNITAQSTLVEVGVNISGLKTFTWTKTNSTNILPNVGIIRNVNDNSIIKMNINVSGQISDTATIIINNATPITIGYRLESTNTNHIGINSNTFTINSIYPVFSGFVTQLNRPLPINIDIVNSNKNVIRSNSDTNFTINSSSSDYCWVAIPQYGSTQFTKWYITALNNGNIGGSTNLFDNGESILLTSGLWTNIPYWVYITNYRTAIQTITLKK